MVSVILGCAIGLASFDVTAFWPTELYTGNALIKFAVTYVIVPCVNSDTSSKYKGSDERTYTESK